MEFKLAGVDSFIIYFGNEINKEINTKVKDAFLTLKELDLDEIIELVPSYTSLYISFNMFKTNHETLINKIKKDLSNSRTSSKSNSKLLQIDVYYGEEVAYDMQRISKINNISIKEIISIHSAKIYDVYTIGFLPAFAYLGIVDKKIATPRLDNPRKKIPKNSLALADAQTAIYSLESPGGWNIIGRTYEDIYNKDYENLSLISFNDKVKFNPISKEKFLDKGGSLES